MGTYNKQDLDTIREAIYSISSWMTNAEKGFRASFKEAGAFGQWTKTLPDHLRKAAIATQVPLIAPDEFEEKIRAGIAVIDRTDRNDAYHFRMSLLNMMQSIAQADGEVTPNELQAIEQIKFILGPPPQL